jgi:hypothetical protein
MPQCSSGYAHEIKDSQGEQDLITFLEEDVVTKRI